MSVSVVASTASCLGVVSSGAPGTVSFNPTSSAELLVVAVGWSSAASLTEPLLTFGGQIMTLQSSNVEWDSASGAVTFYSLPLVSPSDSAVDIVIAPSDFLGNTQIAAFAYAGTSQSLGVQVTAEYGTNSSGVDTGTTDFTGVSTGSITTFVGMTFFGGTPAVITANSGWTGITQATASNEGVYGFYNATSGNISITVTPSPDSFFNMLCVGWEVLAGTPATTGSGVNLVAYDAACLGIISSADPGTLSFNPTTAANYLVATVGWASSSPLTPPSVSFGSSVMAIVASPIEVDGGNGAVAIYVLPLSSATAQTVTVNSAPNYAGYTSIVLGAYSNTSQQLGVLAISEFGTHDAGVFTGTTDINGVAVGSAFNFSAFTFFGTTPTSMNWSAGWQNIGAVSATNQSVWSYNYEYQNGGDFSINLQNPTNSFNTLNYGYEVLVTGTAPPSSTVTITASQISDLGGIGLNPTSTTFDANGADVLIVCAARTNFFPHPATFTYAGIPLQFISSPAILDDTIGASMDIAVLANPPTGPQTLLGGGPSGYFGDTVVMLVGLGNLSGVAGMRASYSGQGDSASVTLGSCAETGSLVLAFVSSPFTHNVEVPNYGWQTVQTDEAASIFANIFSALGSSSLALYLSNSGFASTQAIVLEMETALSVTPNQTGSGSSAVSAFSGSGTGTFTSKLTPNGQTFHIYWDSWLDQPMKEVADMQPDDFYLSRIPDYVAAVCLSFAVPQCSYAGTSSNIKATVGLNFPGSVTLFQQTIALLKTRNPSIKVYVAVQQNTPEQAYPNPYTTSWPGWGGMTSDHVANLKQFLEDCDLDGVVIDYECLDSNEAVEYHCTINQTTGIPACYTDTEFVSVVNLMRAGLPRPITLIIDGFSVGAYVGDYYFGGQPVGYNSGYAYCIAQNADALAAIDGIHIESYDAGNLYDPRVALRSYVTMFPGVPIWLGLRVGPVQYEGVKQTAFNFVDYCNTVIMLDTAGVQMYSHLWDAVPPPGLNNALASGAPFGNYGPDFPDANVCAAVVANVFELGTAAQTGANANANEIRLTTQVLPRGLKAPGLN